MRYWHGGQRGLRVGSELLPPSRTGAKATSDYAEIIPGGHVMRPDRVYVTTDRDAAFMYAGMHPSGGTVYEVEPIGALVDDPDCTEPGLSYECERARIISRQNLSGYQTRKVRKALLGAA